MALSSTCKVMHELGADARQRRFACAACGHPIFDPAAAIRDSGGGSPWLVLQDGQALSVAAEHAVGCRLGSEAPSTEWHLHWSLAVKLGLLAAVEDPGV